MKIQQLFCGPGNHEWTRPAQGGRLPEFCPMHAGEPRSNFIMAPVLAKKRVELLNQAMNGAKKREPLAIIRLSKSEIAWLQQSLASNSDPMAAQILRRM